MGKGTDKLYITHSEWNSGDQFSASAGANVGRDNEGLASFKRLPFNCCALSLRPFDSPVCTVDGTIFDHENIIRWLAKHHTNPVTGKALRESDLITVNFTKNEANDFVDPITFKEFTDNTHIIAIRHGDSANTFNHDTIERLNFKPKVWRDLVSDEKFSRQDIITVQDPQNLRSRDLTSFKYLKENEDTGVLKEDASVNKAAIGSAARILNPDEAVPKARVRQGDRTANSTSMASVATTSNQNNTLVKNKQDSFKFQRPSASKPFNATNHTTGLAAASFTSTGMTPHTSASLALMSDEEFLLKRGRVKEKGYARIETNLGMLTIELITEYAPKAVWNFIRLSQNRYYSGMNFHRNIPKFMIQGGDPTGTGKGGSSIWNRNFEDETDGPLKHDARGVVSMANKGKDTNSSQFFIVYRSTPHLDRKHTIFGRIVEGEEVLKLMEGVPVDSKSNRPLEDITIRQITVFVDPFEEFWTKQKDSEKETKKKGRRADGTSLDDERTTWTGKRMRGDGAPETGSTIVGKYLASALANRDRDTGTVDEYTDGVIDTEPLRKRAKGGKGGGFGNFDSW